MDILGNTLVRTLINKNFDVRASVRNLDNTMPFVDLKCEVVYADLLDKKSLQNAIKGIDVLFHVAAVFKHWSVDPQKDIIDANVIGTKKII